MTTRKGSWAVLLLVAGLLALARWRFGDQLEPKQLVQTLRELGSEPGAVPLFIGLYALGSSALLPAVGFHIVAAVVWGYWPGFALSMVCFNLVSNAHFWVGRWIGQARVEAWLARRGWSGAAIHESGVTTMIAVRQLPLPFVAVNVAAGASPLKGWQFVVGSGLGGLPPTLVYTYFATAMIEGVEGARTEALLRALGGGAMVLLLALAPKLWARWRNKPPLSRR